MAVRSSPWREAEPTTAATGTETQLEAPAVSVVIPVHDEQDNVEALHARLLSSLEALGRPFEVIVVDDGSRDETYSRFAALAADDDRVKLVRLRRNYGQTAAIAAGF